MEEKKFYVYVLLDPRKPGRYEYEGVDYIFDYEPFYVGKGSGDRSKKHKCECNLQRDRHNIKRNKIQKIMSSGFTDLPTAFVYTTSDEHTAYEEEARIISILGKIIDQTGILTNILDGGAGGSLSGPLSHLFGVKKSPECLRKMSENRKGKTAGENHHLFGKKHSEESKKLMSENRKGKTTGENSPCWGKKWTDEEKAAHSERIKEVWQRLPHPFLGKTHNEDTKAKLATSRVTYRYLVEYESGEQVVIYNALKFITSVGGNKKSFQQTYELNRFHKGVKIIDKMLLPDNWLDIEEYREEYYREAA